MKFSQPRCIVSYSLTSFLFRLCFPGSPEGGGLHWQVLGIHVRAKYPCNISLWHLSPPFLYSLSPSLSSAWFTPTFLSFSPECSLLSFLVFHRLSLSLSPLTLHSHRYGNRQIQLPRLFFNEKDSLFFPSPLPLFTTVLCLVVKPRISKRFIVTVSQN